MENDLKNKISGKVLALKEQGVEHEIIKHPPIKTVEEGLAYLGIEAADGVSTLIFKADGKFIAVSRRDDHFLDKSKIKKELNSKNLEMATDDEILQQTGGPKGATPMITGLFTLMDETILEKKFVYGGTGSFEHDLKIKPKDLARINKAIVGDFIDSTVKQRVKKRVFSGIRATGRLHLGNYLGAVKGFLELQDKYDCIFGVMALHAITTPYDPQKLVDNTRQVVLDYLAAGLDPRKCHLMVQSFEHVDLSYLLSTIYPVSRLEDLPTYKDKKAQYPQNVNLALLYYPVLMTADILLYKAELVPVGIDQEPHLEVAREIARKFNSLFGQTFPEPQRFDTPGRYVPSLTGSGKMSKTVEGSFINLTDDLETIKKKLSACPTDSGQGEKVPQEGGVAALLTFVNFFEGEERKEKYIREYEGHEGNGGIKYAKLKEELAEAIYQELVPIQAKRKDFEEHPKMVDQILEEGRIYCSKIAQETLLEVRGKMGLQLSS